MKESVLLGFAIVGAAIKSICVDYKTNVLNAPDCQGRLEGRKKRGNRKEARG